MTRGHWHRIKPGMYRARGYGDDGTTYTFELERFDGLWWVCMFSRGRLLDSGKAPTKVEAQDMVDGWL